MEKINGIIETFLIKKKKGLVLFIIFLTIYIASVLLFVLLANFNYETLLMIIASIVCGLLLIICLYFLLEVFLFSKTQIEFYKSIVLEKENIKEIDIGELDKITVSKNINLYSLDNEGKNLFFLPFIDTSSLKGKYKAYCLGNYIYEVESDEK